MLARTFPPARPALAAPSPAPAPITDPLVPLTRREHEVLALLLGGPSNRQIAAALAISERTAEAHVANILGKLGLANRAQVVAWAATRGWQPVPPDARPAGGALGTCTDVWPPHSPTLVGSAGAQ
jgi:DNA-binding NarL/FixJ family response regulator